MSALAAWQAADMVMADYKSTIIHSLSGVPDIVIETGTGILMAVGEIKVYWIRFHDLHIGKAEKSKA